MKNIDLNKANMIHILMRICDEQVPLFCSDRLKNLHSECFKLLKQLTNKQDEIVEKKKSEKNCRKISRKERFTKKCSKCKDSYIADEYSVCDYCFMHQFDFDTEYDALDFLCLKELIPQEQVLKVLRIIKDGIYVHL